MNRIKDLYVGNSDIEAMQNNMNNNVDSRVSFILRKINNNNNISGTGKFLVNACIAQILRQMKSWII